MNCRLLSALALLLIAPSALQAQTGVLVMAHGGTPEWNAEVLDAVEDLRMDYPVAVAFGMADPRTLAAGVDSLLAAGVERILVPRLFLSGDSFRDATEYVLGLSDEKPRWSMHAEHMHQLEIPVPVRMVEEGLLDAPEVGGILTARAEALSMKPESESVLLIAHGAGSEEENDAWLRRMDLLADSVRESIPFAEVKVETLREDWEEEREAAESRIRGWVETQSGLSRDVIVIPFRLSGFGPYAEVLDGLSYRADGKGLLPDRRISSWVRRQVAAFETRVDGEAG